MEIQISGKHFWRAAGRYYLIFPVLVSLALAWGFVSFHRNYLLVKDERPRLVFVKKQFEEEIYQKLVKKDREKAEDIILKSYLNPFEPKATTTEEEEQG